MSFDGRKVRGLMTASAMSRATMQPAGYAAWIADVKLRIRAAQQRAALAVNKELLQLYWQIGRDILVRQAEAGWGTGILGQIEADLRVEFPEMRGFSRSNLAYMRAFAEAWPDPDVIVQRFVGQLPWGQNITLLTKLKTREERLRYAARAVEHVIAEYALRDVNKPIGVAEYQLVQALPAQLEANLPSIERLEAELTEADIDELEKIHHRTGGDSGSTPPTAKPRPAPTGKRHATKTAKTSPGKRTPRSKKAGRC